MCCLYYKYSTARLLFLNSFIFLEIKPCVRGFGISSIFVDFQIDSISHCSMSHYFQFWNDDHMSTIHELNFFKGFIFELFWLLLFFKFRILTHFIYNHYRINFVFTMNSSSRFIVKTFSSPSSVVRLPGIRSFRTSPRFMYRGDTGQEIKNLTENEEALLKIALPKSQEIFRKHIEIPVDDLATRQKRLSEYPIKTVSVFFSKIWNFYSMSFVLLKKSIEPNKEGGSR